MDEFFILLRETLSERGYCFVIGFIGGVLACWRFCPAYWQWRTYRFDVERENRLRKEQECREARARFAELRRKKRAAALYEEAKNGLEYDADGYLKDCKGNVYCGVCLIRGIRSAMIHTGFDYSWRYRCPKCGHVI